MAEEKLTHWRKNNDPRYISGEDLQFGAVLNHGLRPEMVVQIERFEDAPTYDQTKKENATKTGFWLKDLETGKQVYKPVILNNTNAKFCVDEFKSQFMEHWIGKPIILYAKPDSRFGFVARFKKYYPPATATPDAALAALKKATTLAELAEIWAKIPTAERKLPIVMAEKERLKGVLK